MNRLTLALTLALLAAPRAFPRAEETPTPPSLEDIQRQIQEKVSQIKRLQANLETRAREDEAAEIRGKALPLVPIMQEELRYQTGRKRWGLRQTTFAHITYKFSLTLQGEGKLMLQELNAGLTKTRSELDSVKSLIRAKELRLRDVRMTMEQLNHVLSLHRAELKALKIRKETLLLCGIPDSTPVLKADYDVYSGPER